MREAFENREESVAGLYRAMWRDPRKERGEVRTVLRSPMSLARAARSHKASTFVGSRLHNLPKQ